MSLPVYLSRLDRPVRRGGAETVGRRSLASTRRPQILRAFEACVLRYGLEGSSLERIAQEAGVRRSLIRHYFGNRNELTEALIEGVIERTVSVYRDVIALQTGAGGALVNEEARDMIIELARRSTPESNIRRIDAVFHTRNQMMEFNATPMLALESMMVSLKV